MRAEEITLNLTTLCRQMCAGRGGSAGRGVRERAQGWSGARSSQQGNRADQGEQRGSECCGSKNGLRFLLLQFGFIFVFIFISVFVCSAVKYFFSAGNLIKIKALYMYLNLFKLIGT